MSDLDYSKYYVLIKKRGDRIKEYLRPGGGFAKFLAQNNILARRLIVDSPAEFQAALDAGRKFQLYKYDMRSQNWKSLLLLDSTTTSIEGEMLVYRGTPKPLKYTGALRTSRDVLCLDSFVVEQEDKQAIRSAKEDQVAAAAANRVRNKELSTYYGTSHYDRYNGE